MTSAGERVLVTGAAGWFGRSLVQRLLDDGFHVVAIDRREVEIRPADARTEWHMVDAADVTALRRAIGAAGLHHVMHAATVTASPDPTPMGSTSYLVRHAAMASAALELAVEAGATATFISSAAVFAPDQAGPLDEQASTDGVGPYATAKRVAELMWFEAARAGVMARVFRLGNLFGPDERESVTRPRLSIVRGFVASALRDGHIVVEMPRALRDWTWLPDVAAVVAASLRNGPAVPLVNAVAPRHVHDLQLASLVADLVPGTLVEVREARAAESRRPMVSRVPAILEHPWSPLEQGLSMMLASMRPQA